MFLKKFVPNSLHPKNTIGKYILNFCHNQVIGGPFKGMTLEYPAKFFSDNTSAIFPKLLGIYEKEIFGFLERMEKSNHDAVINIGAGEGYYAVGLAILKPETNVLAYEIIEDLRELISKNALANSVKDRIKINGYCSNTDLNKVIQSYKRPLIMIDCEGFEFELLDPAKTVGLNSCDILVETHDYNGTDTFDILINRFKNSHHIEFTNALPRTTKDIPISLPIWAKFLPEYYSSYVAREGRVKTDQKWILLTSKITHSTTA